MNVILDVTRVVRRLFKGRTLTGIDRVTMAYVQYYASQARALVRYSGHSWVLSQKQSSKLFSWLITPKSKWKLVGIVIKGIIENEAIKAGDNLFLLNTGHVSLGRSDYKRLRDKAGVKPVFFIHDIFPITHPEYHGMGEKLKFKQKIDYILSLAQGIISNSETTQRDLLHYLQQITTTIPKVTTALLGSGLSVKYPKKRPIDKPYFVILSTIEPRKNHLLLLQIWRKLSQNGGLQTPHLFIIGQRGWECENAVDLLERCESLKKVVTEVSHCSDADLATYLHHCQALLTPSFTEGYGLPLIEALSLGVPVIASDLPVFREIAGEVPEYIDPMDGKQWETLILEYARDNSSRRLAQKKRIKGLKLPTWEEHFDRVDSFLQTL